MKIAICDDDMNCINKIENYIEKIDRNNAECDGTKTVKGWFRPSRRAQSSMM